VPVGKGYNGAVQQPSGPTASIEMMWKHGVNTLAAVFSSDATQIISLFQDYFDNLRQFASVKKLYSNCKRLEIRLFIDL
jgi:hypothetical protein